MSMTFIKEPNLSDYDFSNCIDADKLTTTEKLTLAKTFQEILHHIHTIDAYPGAHISEEKRQAVVDTIMPVITSNPNLLYIFNIDHLRNYSTSIANECIRANCDTVVKYALQDSHAATIVDHLGRNLGMRCAYEGNEELTLLSLDNKIARRQQNNNGLNIGMISAKNKLLAPTLKALDDEIVSAQLSSDSENIGMICARIINGDRRMIPAFEKAASNPNTILAKNNQGKTMLDTAKQSGYNEEKINKNFAKTILKAQMLEDQMSQN